MIRRTLFLALFLPFLCLAQNENYDPAMAEELGADEYGMKYYTFVLLTTGENKDTDPEAKQISFEGHMENIKVLAERGDLIVSGPFGENKKSFRGIFILNTADIEEAKEWLSNDTAIENGYLKAHYIPWYGSAALPNYLPDADKVWQKKP